MSSLLNKPTELIFHLGRARYMTQKEADEITENSDYIRNSSDQNCKRQWDEMMIRKIVNLLLSK